MTSEILKPPKSLSSQPTPFPMPLVSNIVQYSDMNVLEALTNWPSSHRVVLQPRRAYGIGTVEKTSALCFS
jgi:hypothetical protein